MHWHLGCGAIKDDGPWEMRCSACCCLLVPLLILEPWGLKYCFLLTGAYGPEHWVTSSVSCRGRHQSPIDILDQHARIGEEFQELQLDGFDNESSNKTWMKNTGKTGRLWLLYPSTKQHERFLDVSGFSLHLHLLLKWRTCSWVRALESALSLRTSFLLS